MPRTLICALAGAHAVNSGDSIAEGNMVRLIVADNIIGTVGFQPERENNHAGAMW